MPIIDPPQELLSGSLYELPQILAMAYAEELKSRRLYTKAIGPRPTGLIGGSTNTEQRSYFAHNFCTSAIRPQTILLSKKIRQARLIDDILVNYAQGRVALLDIPAGSGATTLGFLTTLATLRKSNRIPSFPLTIDITAADRSEYALNIYRMLLDRLIPKLKQSGIVATMDPVPWDATQLDQTEQLCGRWLTQSNPMIRRIILVSNISGVTKGKFSADYLSSFIHILTRSMSTTKRLHWIEFGSKNHESGYRFLKWIVNTLSSRTAWLKPLHDLSYPKTERFRWIDRLTNTSPTGSRGIVIWEFK